MLAAGLEQVGVEGIEVLRSESSELDGPMTGAMFSSIIQAWPDPGGVGDRRFRVEPWAGHERTERAARFGSSRFLAVADSEYRT
jgi:hypothetical protein